MRGQGMAAGAPASGARRRLGLIAVAGALGLGAGAARAETLQDAAAQAYQSNPTLQGQRAQLRALDESYVQARSGYRPQVSAGVEGDYTQTISTYNQPIQDIAASVSASQPIYNGGATSAETRAAEADIAAGREQLRQVEASVLQQVITAYADVRRDQQALDIAQTNVAVLQNQLAETRARFDVGQLTRTDVAQAEARLAAAQAQQSSARAQLAVSRAAYAAVVGQSPGDLAPEPALPGLPASVDDAFATASRNNPAILGADFDEQAAAARVAAAKAANHPTLALRAQVGETGYYANAAALGVSNGLWARSVTASAVFTQPLFTGGLNGSRIRQALETDNAKRIAIEGAQRQTVQQVAQAWNQLNAAHANTASNGEQVRADQVAFEGVRQEAGVGLRTTLDVLNAEQELRAAELALVNARHDEYLAGAGLLSAMGRLEIAVLDPGLPAYDPEKSFNRVRRAGSVPWEGLV
ncbi:MAG: TolC family outer membrane protein, partial [Caulobacteraceae bacterium]|nr:TolC family outer membrane protein [Caulobacteraceae bacterium]